MCDVWYNEHATGQGQHSGVGTQEDTLCFYVVVFMFYVVVATVLFSFKERKNTKVSE